MLMGFATVSERVTEMHGKPYTIEDNESINFGCSMWTNAEALAHLKKTYPNAIRYKLQEHDPELSGAVCESERNMMAGH